MRNRSVRSLFVLSLLLSVCLIDASGKVIHLLPKPQSIVMSRGEKAFALKGQVDIVLENDNDRKHIEAFLNDMNMQASMQAKRRIVVKRVRTIDGASNMDEAYQLKINKKFVIISAVNEIGVLRAVQTMRQLAQGYKKKAVLEALTIIDYPAFRVRGFMHDVGRGFISVAELEREIDILARFKINVFHFHLTDNQGWRIEVKQYPQLTEKSFSRLYGKYYTQKEVRHLVEYCRDRGMTLIPEVDMPGHSQSFTRAMGFDMQTDVGVNALKNIVSELCKDVFYDVPYFHIGTDETEIHYLDFVPMMVSYVRSKGKKAMSWHPGARYKQGEIDMLQLWSSNGRAEKGIPSIESRYHYANHYDTYADVVGLYKSNIYYHKTGSDDLYGAIIGFWNDRALPTERDIVAQNGLYAATLALAERAWIGGGEQYIESGGVMLPSEESDEFKAFADWERRFLFHKEHEMAKEAVPYVKQTNVKWRITDAFPNDGNKEKIFPPETDGLQPSYQYNNKTYNTAMATGAGIYLRHTWGKLIPAFYADPQPNATAYAYTYVYSPRKQMVGAQIEFQNYGRSENDLPPQQGCWDNKGSKVIVNGEEIQPPIWENKHSNRSSEVTLKNENMSARKPICINLNKGWNSVLIKLPNIGWTSKRVRLEKWMFTFVLTDITGRNAADGLIYSPEKSKK